MLSVSKHRAVDYRGWREYMGINGIPHWFTVLSLDSYLLTLFRALPAAQAIRSYACRP